MLWNAYFITHLKFLQAPWAFRRYRLTDSFTIKKKILKKKKTKKNKSTDFGGHFVVVKKLFSKKFGFIKVD